MWCHFPCGSVDWNKSYVENGKELERHFPCGSVDWNINITYNINGFSVTSLAEVWIETLDSRCILVAKCVTSLAEVWIETVSSLKNGCGIFVTSLAEVWIETALWEWCPRKSARSLPLRKCGLKRYHHGNFMRTEKSLPLRKCGLKPVMMQPQSPYVIGHFPCGSVDWNFYRGSVK